MHERRCFEPGAIGQVYKPIFYKPIFYKPISILAYLMLLSFAGPGNFPLQRIPLDR